MKPLLTKCTDHPKALMLFGILLFGIFAAFHFSYAAHYGESDCRRASCDSDYGEYECGGSLSCSDDDSGSGGGTSNSGNRIRVVNQRCLTGQSEVRVTIQNNNTGSGTWTLYIDGRSYGRIGTNGARKTVRVSHNTSHDGRIHRYWETGGGKGGVNRNNANHYFDFNSPQCDPPATASLHVRNTTTGGGWTSGSLTIDPNEEIGLRWSSSYANSCSGSGSGFNTGGNTGGTDNGVNEPAPGSSRNYSLSCSGPGGSGSDSLRVTTRHPNPTVTFDIQNTTDSTAWTDDDITIDPIDDVALRWSSTDATSCSGSNFSVPGNNTDGTQTSVNEPPAGDTRAYTIVCSGPGGSTSAARSVTTDMGGIPTISAETTYIRLEEDVTLTWDTKTNDPATCSLTGPNVDRSSLPSITGTTDVTIYGESTFTIDCPGGTADTRVEVLPQIEEI